jgi:hypothetical protein
MHFSPEVSAFRLDGLSQAEVLSGPLMWKEPKNNAIRYSSTDEMLYNAQSMGIRTRADAQTKALSRVILICQTCMPLLSPCRGRR